MMHRLERPNSARAYRDLNVLKIAYRTYIQIRSPWARLSIE